MRPPCRGPARRGAGARALLGGTPGRGLAQKCGAIFQRGRAMRPLATLNIYQAVVGLCAAPHGRLFVQGP